MCKNLTKGIFFYILLTQTFPTHSTTQQLHHKSRDQHSSTQTTNLIPGFLNRNVFHYMLLCSTIYTMRGFFTYGRYTGRPIWWRKCETFFFFQNWATSSKYPWPFTTTPLYWLTLSDILCPCTIVEYMCNIWSTIWKSTFFFIIIFLWTTFGIEPCACFARLLTQPWLE